MKSKKEFAVSYPRRRLTRFLLRVLGRVLVKLLTRTKVYGLENIPETGPVILAANHVSYVEAVLLAVFPPRQVEFLGAGDLPFEAGISSITRLYDFIPVNRGNIDRNALKASLDVLAQEGVLAIFPEGGTWEKTEQHAHTGVALLAIRSGAPVVPIGLSGMHKSLSRALSLKRPQITMKLGKPIPAPKPGKDTSEIKESMQCFSNLVLENIQSLLTEEEIASQPVSFTYSLDLEPLPEGVEPGSLGAQTLARMLLSDVILDSFYKNLRLPIEALYQSNAQDGSISAYIAALEAISKYLDINPAFFNYRYGIESGLAIKEFIHKLAASLEKMRANEQAVTLRAQLNLGFQDGHSQREQRLFKLLP